VARVRGARNAGPAQVRDRASAAQLGLVRDLHLARSLRPKANAIVKPHRPAVWRHGLFSDFLMLQVKVRRAMHLGFANLLLGVLRKRDRRATEGAALSFE
jgi:hypothetical protein